MCSFNMSFTVAPALQTLLERLLTCTDHPPRRNEQSAFDSNVSGNYDLKNESRGRPETQGDNDELKMLLEVNPS